MKFSCPLALALILPVIARADTYMVSRQGGCIAPMVSNDVCMESEVVRVNASDEDGYKVEASFVLKNTSATAIDSLVAFPVLELPGFVMKQVDHHFHVEVGKLEGGQEHFESVAFRSSLPAVDPPDASIRDMMIHSPKQITKFPKNIVWPMKWAPGETKLVRIRYTTDAAVGVPHSTECTQATQLTYIVSTGNLWKGRIGKADFYFDFGVPASPDKSDRSGLTPTPDPDPTTLRLTSYAANAKWTGTTRVEWHFHDWAPSDEIFTRWVVWQEVPRYDEKSADLYRYGLSKNYIAQSKRYSPEYLDRLVATETILAKQYFPDRLTESQYRRLRLWIAEWLLHEIFARHGEIFNPIDHYETSGVNRYPVYKSTLWGTAFEGYAWHDGWYRPNHKVNESELNQIEKANLAFLRNEIEKLTQ